MQDPVTLSPNLGWPELEAVALGEHVLRAETQVRACAHAPFTHERQVERGASLHVAAHDWLNPGFGFCATLEGPAGKIRGEGLTPDTAINHLGALLLSGDVRPVI